MSPFKHATELFARVYSTHPGPEPEAFRAAMEVIEPLMPAVKEQIGRWWEPKGI